MSGPRAVRVVTDVAALDREFDYLVPDSWGPLEVGDEVRVDLHHRRVRAWVVGDAVPDGDLKPVLARRGLGPPPSVIALSAWAAWRWVGPRVRFLRAASAPRIVREIPTPPLAAPIESAWEPPPSGVLEVAPTTDPLELVLASYHATCRAGSTLLVLVPTEGWAERLRARLEHRGLPSARGDEWERARAGWPVVVGTRGAAFAPIPRLAGAVVLDADDDGYASTAAPTWNALAVVRERCRREGVPWWASASVLDPVLDAARVGPSAASSGWPRIEVVDRRRSDPHDGVLSREAVTAAHQALAGEEPVAVVVLHPRLGRGRLVACALCGELQRCATCGLAEREIEATLRCDEGHETRERFCRACGSTRVRAVRSGVTTLARDVAAQLGQPVSEVTASTPDAETWERVVVGTEALWGRVRRAGVVIVADFDEYLLAPRASARRDALRAIARAGRLVGSRAEARGRVVIQTRRGDDAVVRAALLGDPSAVRAAEDEDARELGLPPYGWSASLRGPGADAFVSMLDSQRVRVRRDRDDFQVHASDVATLVEELARHPRPPGLRIAVE